MKVFILLLLSFVLLGCTANRKTCIESHEETYDCTYYIYTGVGAFRTRIPVYDECTRIVCDKYEE